MRVRVELMEAAVDDLVGYSESGNLALFLKKLLRMEEVGAQAGQPLGGGLTGWRKIVVGDRNWRIIFRVDTLETLATVWVIGDRDDAACYEQARARIAALEGRDTSAVTLATVIFQLSERRLERSTTRKRRRSTR